MKRFFVFFCPQCVPIKFPKAPKFPKVPCMFPIAPRFNIYFCHKLNFMDIFELSIKFKKHNTGILSLVINRVRYKKPTKKYISIPWGLKFKEPLILVIN